MGRLDKNKLRYKYAVPAASRLPEGALSLLNMRFPHVGETDEGIGWNFWADASYLRYTRYDMKKHPERYEEGWNYDEDLEPEDL